MKTFYYGGLAQGGMCSGLALKESWLRTGVFGHSLSCEGVLSAAVKLLWLGFTWANWLWTQRKRASRHASNHHENGNIPTASLCQDKLPLIKENKKVKVGFIRQDEFPSVEPTWVDWHFNTHYPSHYGVPKHWSPKTNWSSAVRKKPPAAKKLPNIPIGWTSNKSLHFFSCGFVYIFS